MGEWLLFTLYLIINSASLLCLLYERKYLFLLHDASMLKKKPSAQSLELKELQCVTLAIVNICVSAKWADVNYAIV